MIALNAVAGPLYGFVHSAYLFWSIAALMAVVALIVILRLLRKRS